MISKEITFMTKSCTESSLPTLLFPTYQFTRLRTIINYTNSSNSAVCYFESVFEYCNEKRDPITGNLIHKSV